MAFVGLTKDSQVTGDRISKEYRDRYANFSKGAHFTLGGQDGAAKTQQKAAFASPGPNKDKNKVLDENIRTMRASHFDVGLTKDSYMYPASYKVQQPEGGFRPKPIDKNLLGRESWILGQCPETFNTINQKSFSPPRGNATDRKTQNEQARVLRSKVSSTSIRNVDPRSNSMDATLNYQTNSAIVHKQLGEIQTVDKDVQKAQRKKLTQANFTVGASPAFYDTTNKIQYVRKHGAAHSQDQRKQAVDGNRRTNFISQKANGFEDPQKKFDFGIVPNKGKADDAQVNAMIDNLRREHFRLGEQQSPFMRTNEVYGSGVKGARKDGQVPWATMKTSFSLGGDHDKKATDYQNRFAVTEQSWKKTNLNPVPYDECKRNKAKITSDSVVIAGNAHFDTTVTSRTQFQNVFNAGKGVNTGLDALTTSYITGSHFKPGYGGFGGQPEQKRAYNPSNGPAVENKLEESRIKFFKDAHFDHRNPNMQETRNTSMKGSFYERDLNGRKTINDGNNAFSLRHKIHNYGKIGTQSTTFVTDDQMRYKWVQPNNKDPGPTASMGLIKK